MVQDCEQIGARHAGRVALGFRPPRARLGDGLAQPPGVKAHGDCCGFGQDTGSSKVCGPRERRDHRSYGRLQDRQSSLFVGHRYFDDHLVLHTNEDAGTKQAETQAHQFAAAFLMPRHDILHELPQRPDWDRLLALKAKWQVSLAALLKRASTLETLRPELYTQAMKTMSARRWRTQEPGDLGPPERPTLLARAVEVAGKNGTSLEDLSADRGLPLTDIREMLAPSLDPRPRVTL
ncbi:MAG: ImmA/IrrE family metallo-endopeptidase [Mycobacteriales bacterium]